MEAIPSARRIGWRVTDSSTRFPTPAGANAHGRNQTHREVSLAIVVSYFDTRRVPNFGNWWTEFVDEMPVASLELRIHKLRREAMTLVREDDLLRKRFELLVSG